MIRYQVSPNDIETAVNAIDAKWLEKAKKRTAAFVGAGKYEEASSIWSTVKPAFMKIQHNKCLFCERKLESEKYGKIEHDLEHFRPKSSVRIWPDAGLHGFSFGFPTGEASQNGYFWLPYALANYAASCKSCNTALKSDYFPIEGVRLVADGDLKSEKAFLCYPIGEGDDDPERLVTFLGITAVPVAKTGHKRRRAEIIIRFFDLNGRDLLLDDRAKMIMVLGNALIRIADGQGDARDQAIVQACLQPTMEHASCTRAFHRMWGQDQPYARKLHAEAQARFLQTQGITI